MRFSVYSEVQSWLGRSPKRLDTELAERIVPADQLGYSSYAIVEHFFFPA